MGYAAKSCFFIGHRHADRHIYERLLAAVRRTFQSMAQQIFLWDITETLTGWQHRR